MSESEYKTAIDQFTNKKFNRRSFLISAGVITGGISLGGALTYFYRKNNLVPPFTNSQSNLVAVLHNHLFPKSEDSPGASDINSAKYLELVLLDENVDEDDRNLLKNGVTWLEEAAQESHNKSFVDLIKSEKDEVLRSIEEYNWGYRFLSLNLTYIIEALLSDPIYGGNTNEIGWKWLNHVPGVPKPSKSSMYKLK